MVRHRTSVVIRIDIVPVGLPPATAHGTTRVIIEVRADRGVRVDGISLHGISFTNQLRCYLITIR